MTYYIALCCVYIYTHVYTRSFSLYMRASDTTLVYFILKNIEAVRWGLKLLFEMYKNHVPQKSGSPRHFFLKNTFFSWRSCWSNQVQNIRGGKAYPTMYINKCIFSVFFGILRFWLDIWYHQRTKAWLSNQSALRKSNKKHQQKQCFFRVGVNGGRTVVKSLTFLVTKTIFTKCIVLVKK